VAADPVERKQESQGILFEYSHLRSFERYLTVRVLRQLAEDEKTRFPQGAKAPRQDTYVDDIVSGASTLEETRQLRDELVQLCMAGGFPLQKWTANHAALLSGIPPEHRAGRIDETFLASEVQAVLGLRWNLERDYLALSVRSPPPALHIKRSLLSRAAQLFDPLGWIASVIVRAKLLIQSTWLQQLDWDAPLAEEEISLWSGLENELPLREDSTALMSARWPTWISDRGPRFLGYFGAGLCRRRVPLGGGSRRDARLIGARQILSRPLEAGISASSGVVRCRSSGQAGRSCVRDPPSPFGLAAPLDGLNSDSRLDPWVSSKVDDVRGEPGRWDTPDGGGRTVAPCVWPGQPGGLCLSGAVPKRAAVPRAVVAASWFPSPGTLPVAIGS